MAASTFLKICCPLKRLLFRSLYRSTVACQLARSYFYRDEETRFLKKRGVQESLQICTPSFVKSMSSAPVSDPSEWKCWKCDARQAGLLFFCPACNGVVHPETLRTTDYFDILNEKRTFDIDLKRLATRFKDLQKLLHPDKVVNLPQLEQEYAQQLSSLINKSYGTLVRPIERGLYLLELHGKPLEEGTIQMDSVFLLQIMETNEELSGMKNVSDARTMDEDNKRTMEDILRNISSAFAEGDIEGARFLLGKLQYFANIDEKIRKLELQ